MAAGVLIPDHFHLLVMPIKKNISEIMHDLKSYTAAKVSEQILLNHGAKCRRGVEAAAVDGTDIPPRDYRQTFHGLPTHSKRQAFHALPSYSKRKTISIKIWQRSFYYHIITNDFDFENHFNYIIYNPVKHGCAAESEDWPYLWYDFEKIDV